MHVDLIRIFYGLLSVMNFNGDVSCWTSLRRFGLFVEELSNRASKTWAHKLMRLICNYTHTHTIKIILIVIIRARLDGDYY